eukprot:scaffold24173_cov162-Cylindrotheca_fusiformis.AAC.6
MQQHRFKNNPAAAVSFLKAALQHAEAACIAEQQQQQDILGETAFQTAPLLSKEIETSLMTPRMGKVKIQLAERDCRRQGGLLATRIGTKNASQQQQQQLHVPNGSVSHLIIFPKPEDCKLIRSISTSTSTSKVRMIKAHVVLIKLRTAIQFQGKDVDQICFSLPWDKKLGSLGPQLTGAAATEDEKDGSMSWQDATTAWRRVLAKAFGCGKNDNDSDDDDDNNQGDSEGQETLKVTQVRVDNPVFTSHIDTSTSTTTSGMPFVSCNLGVQDGVLYPLQQGSLVCFPLLNIRPPKFFPRSSLKEVVFGRGASAGQSSSRYVDMAVLLKDNKGPSDPNPSSQKLNNENLKEFTSILIQEQGALQEYKDTFLSPYLDKAENNNENTDSFQNAHAVGELEVEEVSDDDANDENFSDSEAEDSEEEDDADDSDMEGVEVVADDFALELVRSKRESDSATESEESDSSSALVSKRKMRHSKRLKRS